MKLRAFGLVRLVLLLGLGAFLSAGVLSYAGLLSVEQALKPAQMGWGGERAYVYTLDNRLVRWGLAFSDGDDVAGELQKSTPSTLTLYENGKALGPAHSLDRIIRGEGGGAYSHRAIGEARALLFSSSDNSDPRGNGRSYRVRYPLKLMPDLFLAGLAAFLILLAGERRPGRSSRAGWGEGIVVVGSLSVLFLLVAGCLDAISLVRTSDSAAFYQLVQTTFDTGVPRSSIGGSSFDATTVFALPAAEVCRMPLSDHYGADFNILLRDHAYLIAYPLSLLVAFSAPDRFIPALTAFGYVAFLGLVYLVVRRAGGARLAAALTALLVAAHPVWSKGIVADYYPDRLFLPFGCLLLLLLHEPISRGLEIGAGRWAAILVTALLAASTNDRSNFYVGLIFGGLLILYWPRLAWRSRGVMAGLAGVFGAGFFVYILLITVHPQINGVVASAAGDPWQMLAHVLSSSALKFVVIDGLCFGLLALFEWRLALLAGVAMVPNLLVPTGAWWTVGFFDHYHSQYFAILGYAVAQGVARAWRLASRPPCAGAGLARPLVLAGLAGLAGLLLFADEGVPVRFTGADWSVRVFAKVATFYAQPDLLWEVDAQKRALAVRAAVPASAVVSAYDGYMATLYRHREPTIYPMNIDRSDYLVLQFTVDGQGRRHYTGGFSYRGQTEALDACLDTRLRTQGFDLDHPVHIDYGLYRTNGVAVLKREGGP
jgi:hypothetical protein